MFNDPIVAKKTRESRKPAFTTYKGIKTTGSGKPKRYPEETSEPGKGAPLLEFDHFLACQFILDTLDNRVQMLLLVDKIQVVGPDRENRAHVERPQPVIVE